MGSANEDETAVSKNTTYKEKLSKLECPFTWDMDDVGESIFTDYNPHDEEDSIPLLKLLREIMTIYEKTKDGEIMADDVLTSLKKCDDNFRVISDMDDPEISTKVVYAVLQATKCFVYLKLNMEKELDLVYENLENMDNMNDKEKSTLLGCKSICWSKYHRGGSKKAEEIIRKAIQLNNNCSVWHYILGKNIRRQRRNCTISNCPGPEEESSFLKAYRISKNSTYGIFVAQMYRESRDYKKALSMYEDLFANLNSLGNTVLLRLALGFINQMQLSKAKICLDKAEETCAKHSMYLHYRGIYHMKKKQYVEAENFFKEAIKDLNLPAEKQYLECILKSQKSVDATKYLLKILERYKSLSPEELQPTILDVAFSYWKRERDLKEAIKYFLNAIEINPQAECLTKFYNRDVYPIKDRNVYVFLDKYIFPVINCQRSQFDEATIERVNAIKKIIHLNNVTRMNSLGDAFTRIKIKK